MRAPLWTGNPTGDYPPNYKSQTLKGTELLHIITDLAEISYVDSHTYVLSAVRVLLKISRNCAKYGPDCDLMMAIVYRYEIIRYTAYLASKLSIYQQ